MKRILLAGTLGGLIAFIWSAVVHMLPSTQAMGLSLLNAKEAPVLASLKANVTQPGLYFFPGIDLASQPSESEKNAWVERYRSGPVGLLLYRPVGGEMMEPRQLIVEFVSTLACAFLAAAILTATVGPYFRRVLIVAALGLFTWLALSISQWNWYGYPFAFITLDLLDQAIGWFFAGLAMAAIIRPAQSRTSAQPA
jgi:hypothetical protein